MIKDTNKQISIVIPKSINEKLKIDAKNHDNASRNWMARKILVEYYRNKEKETL